MTQETASVSCASPQEIFKDSITEISRQLVMPFTLDLCICTPTPERVKEMLETMATFIDGIPSTDEIHTDIYYATGIFNHAIFLLLALQNAKSPIYNPAEFSIAIMHNIINLLVKKNHDYGNSFGNQLARRGSIVFAIRMEDKVSRLRTLINEEAQVKDESIFDTLNDIIGYCILFLHHTK